MTGFDAAAAEIQDAVIGTVQIKALSAEITKITEAQIGSMTMTTAQIEDLATSVAVFVNARIARATTSWTNIDGLTTNTLFTTNEVTDKVYISDSSASSARY